MATIVPRQIALPFRISAEGKVAYATQPATLARQEVRTIVQTTIGERVMKPEFGSPIAYRVFDPIVTGDSDQLASDLLFALQRWCVRASILNVSVNIGVPNEGSLEIDVDFTSRPFTTVLTEAIEFGEGA
jgi:phage baseplate assembly protein W